MRRRSYHCRARLGRRRHADPDAYAKSMADGATSVSLAGLRIFRRPDCRRGQRVWRQPGMDTGVEGVQSAHAAANSAAGTAADARCAQILFRGRPAV